MYFKIYGLFTKLLCSVSGRALPKPFCYEDIRTATYKATCSCLRFPGLLNSWWPTTCSVREQATWLGLRQMSYKIIFLFIDLKGSASPFVLSPVCSHLPSALTDCTGWEGHAKGTLARQTSPPRQAPTARRPGPAAWLTLLVTPDLGFLSAVESEISVPDFRPAPNWGYYSLPRSQSWLDSWLYVTSPCLCLLPVLLPWFVKTFSWPLDLTSFS